MKIRIENSSTTTGKLTGVGYYTKLLTEALGRIDDVEVHAAQFNFLGRKAAPSIETKHVVEPINFPQKIYAKLAFARVAFPFDLTLSRVDATIFPNFALWPTVKSKLKIVTVHDLSFVNFPEVVEEKNLTYLKRVVPNAVRKADLVLTVSNSVKDEIVKEFDLDPTKVFVTPVPPADRYLTKTKHSAFKMFSISTKKFILFGGTLEPRKGVDTLIDAYMALPEPIRQEYSLVLAGPMGWKSEGIQAKLASAQKRCSTIVLTGYYTADDAVALYQQASLYVMPSLYEGFGIPLLEAMASETPVIASNIPVLREVGGDATIYFEQGDAKQLSTKIVDVLSDAALQKDLVKRGKENLKRYSWEKVASSLYARIKELG